MNDHNNVCPHCGTSLQGDPIPPEKQHLYGATHFGREIGISNPMTDRTEAYQCPDCGGQWARQNGGKPDDA